MELLFNAIRVPNISQPGEGEEQEPVEQGEGPYWTIHQIFHKSATRAHLLKFLIWSWILVKENFVPPASEIISAGKGYIDL